MYLSQYLKIDENLSFKEFKQFKIKNNIKVKNVYLLCTASMKNELFEIIEGTMLTKKYSDCYLIAISEDKEWIITQLIHIVDSLYRKQTTKYECLKTE
ncbi:MAG: hypothetical protein ACRCSG_03350 [Cellulosilyticaceae bacterium]